MELKEIRKAAGFKTAREFAEVMGIPPTTYARYEQKLDHIPMPNAIRMADYLNVTLDSLVGRVCGSEVEVGEQQRLYDLLSPRGKARVDEFMAYQQWLDGRFSDDGR